jgi:hypothetical protein
VVGFSCVPGVEEVLVLDDALVVASHVEGPDVVLIEAVVYHGDVAIRWVSIDGLALHVVEIELGVVIFRWHNGGLSHGGAILGVEGLQALEVVVLDHAHIIDIIMEVGVLLDRLMEALEGIVEIGGLEDAVSNGVEADLNTVVDLLIGIDALIVINTG